jgi:hypothetical protein
LVADLATPRLKIGRLIVRITPEQQNLDAAALRDL